LADRIVNIMTIGSPLISDGPRQTSKLFFSPMNNPPQGSFRRRGQWTAFRLREQAHQGCYWLDAKCHTLAPVGCTYRTTTSCL